MWRSRKEKRTVFKSVLKRIHGLALPPNGARPNGLITHRFMSREKEEKSGKHKEEKSNQMNRAHLIRLNPTPEQETYFRKACGVARHAFNWALARWKEARAEGRCVKIKDLKREYNRIKRQEFPWSLEVTKCAAEQAFSDLSQAFDNYWRRKKDGTQPKLKQARKDGEEGGFPRFKSRKHDRLSFYLNNDKFRVDGHVLFWARST